MDPRPEPPPALGAPGATDKRSAPDERSAAQAECAPAPGRTWTLRRRLTLVVVVLFLVALAMFLVSSSLLRRRALQNSATAQLSQTLERARLDLENALANLRNLFNQGAVVLTIGESEGGSRIDEQLASLRFLNSGLLNFALYDARGKLVYSLDKLTRESEHSVTDSPWFSQAGLSHRIFSEGKLPLNIDLAGPCFAMSRRIYYAGEGVMHVGVLLMEIDPAIFEHLSGPEVLGRSGRTYLTQADGRWIAPAVDRVRGSRLTPLKPGERASREIDPDDARERFRANVAIEYYDWLLYALVYVDEINEPLQIFSLNVVTTALAVLVLLILAVVFAANQITRPLRQISSDLHAIDSDDFTRSMPVEGKVLEIDNVAAAINRLLRHIERLLAETREKQARIRRAELVALNQQITPHFLGNALDAIIWTFKNGQPDKAIAMIEMLGRLLRSAAALMLDLTLPLGRELDYIRRYMDFQQMRRGNRFTLRIDCPPEVARLHCPHMILQPLVENALQHGLAGLSEGVVTIQARETDACLEIQVEDNGMGIAADRLAAMQDALSEVESHSWTENVDERGIGLVNIQQRIRLLYGAPYGLDVASVEEESTTVTIRLPRVEDDQPI